VSSERVLVIDTGVFLDMDLSKLEARVLNLYATSGDPQALQGDDRRYWLVGTPTGRPSAYDTCPAWAQMSGAAVLADLRRLVTNAKAGQDPPYLEFVRSRPFPDFVPLEAEPQARKVPPVVAHAPPARRGRWSRG